MTTIGGFFELEIAVGAGPYHTSATAMTCGRACFREALTNLAPRRVRLPFYVCDTILEPLKILGLDYDYYTIGEELEVLEDMQGGTDEVVLFVNHFGLKGDIARRLAERLGPWLIVDNTQAFYERGYPGSWSFNSARKFFGVPDGAYLYSPVPLSPPTVRNDAPAWDHLIGRLTGHLEMAYKAFQTNESAITSEVRGMSVGAERILAGIDYQFAAQRRRENFLAYETSLSAVNGLSLGLPDDEVPMCYPFLPRKHIDRAILAAQEIYTPAYWRECEFREPSGFAWERHLSRNLLALPVDQRYGLEEVARVVSVVQKLLEN